MLLEVIENFIKFVFGNGVVICLGRLGLIALYVIGASSIYWGNPLGPVLALILAAILLYRGGHCRLLGILLQPDLAAWEPYGNKRQIEDWYWTVLAMGIFSPFVIALMYNTPLHGAGILPLPTVVMALQKLEDRRKKQGKLKPANAPATSAQHGRLADSPVGEQFVQVCSSSGAGGARDCSCWQVLAREVESRDSCGC